MCVFLKFKKFFYVNIYIKLSKYIVFSFKEISNLKNLIKKDLLKGLLNPSLRTGQTLKCA